MANDWYVVKKRPPATIPFVLTTGQIFAIKDSWVFAYRLLDGTELEGNKYLHNQLCMQNYIEKCNNPALDILYAKP